MHYDRQTVATDVGSVAYVESGRGPDVILIHGALVTADDLVLSLFETLAQRFHVVAFDRPGHGGTDQTATEQGSPWAQAAMLQAASRVLGLQTPVVFGHSFGGAVALCTAMAFPDAIAGVVAPVDCASAETLESALVQAYQNNPTLNSQRASLRATDEGVPQALSGYRPRVTVTATGGEQSLSSLV